MPWNWLSRLLLPADPPVLPDARDEAHTEQAIKAAQEAKRDFESLKRRARSMGIEVDVSRSWGPRGER